MKKTKIVIGIVAVTVIVGGIIFITKNQPAKKFPVNTTQSTVDSINKSEDTTKTSEPGHLIYSEELRKKARNDFINVCDTKIGRQNESVCICVADNLGANYTDLQLTRMFIQYRSSNAIPDEINSAYETCKN